MRTGSTLTNILQSIFVRVDSQFRCPFSSRLGRLSGVKQLFYDVLPCLTTAPPSSLRCWIISDCWGVLRSSQTSLAVSAMGTEMKHAFPSVCTLSHPEFHSSSKISGQPVPFFSWLAISQVANTAHSPFLVKDFLLSNVFYILASTR